MSGIYLIQLLLFLAQDLILIPHCAARHSSRLLYTHVLAKLKNTRTKYIHKKCQRNGGPGTWCGLSLDGRTASRETFRCQISSTRRGSKGTVGVVSFDQDLTFASL
ncbi:hypothetical protein GGS20DRAFT_528621 [Poronia punctata]|nr:hypothetical protein GGS20DRAFT_528621 [Poronia punctata]